MTREFAFTVLLSGIVVLAVGQLVLFWIFSKLYHSAKSLEVLSRSRIDRERGIEAPEKPPALQGAEL